MNIKSFEEVIDATEFVESVGDYVLRKFITSGNYVIIDKLGDFIVLEKDAVESICSSIWEDLAPQEKLN